MLLENDYLRATAGGVLIGVALAVGIHLYRELTVTASSELRDNTLHVRPRGVLWFASQVADLPTILMITIQFLGWPNGACTCSPEAVEA